MALSRIFHVTLCPSCIKCKYAYSRFQGASSLWNSVKSNGDVEKKVTALGKRNGKYKAASQPQIPSLLALKKARQLSKQNIELNTNSDKLKTVGLKSRLENLLLNSDDTSSEHILANEAFGSNCNGVQDEVESIIFPTDIMRNAKTSPILGTEDRDIPPSNIPCVGCGASLQCQHNTFPGFLPSEYFKSLSEREMKTTICQRCYYIRHCGAFKEISTSATEYESVISKIRPTQSVVLLVVDVIDMNGSIVPNLMDYIGANHPLIVVGNKVGMFPMHIPNASNNFMLCMLRLSFFFQAWFIGMQCTYNLSKKNWLYVTSEYLVFEHDFLMPLI